MIGHPFKPLELNRVLPCLIPAGLLLLWFMVSETGLVPGYLMPHPSAVLRAMFSYLFAETGSAPYAGRFWGDLYASSMRVLGGFILAVALGVPLGVMSGRLSCVQRMIATTINGLRSVPGICWLPLALVWFGIGIKATVFLISLAAFFPIYLNAEAGARNVSPVLLQAGAMLGAGRLRGVVAVLLPATMPHIITGLRLGLGVSWAYMVLGEMTGVSTGLGAVVMDARMLGQVDVVVVGIVLIALVGKISDSVLHGLMKIFFRSARRTA
ncbi:NitT/TauT family transport system permease protein [Desulfuromusa kysingii]|uniref:NitT/TauT family transport system permease protein n=1 Tax=Desulfuromusa kysingii TaxID=37625 RepID=A0A1H4A098_9BACT|nr:ABC transporter permease [Desulfuromusa kysingii]SEA29499.1 NitT/TauT family transport system permease protein [Desulfuromusa kysingii]